MAVKKKGLMGKNKKEQYAPNDVYRFYVSLELNSFDVQVAVDEGAFDNDEDKVQEALFTPQRIEELKKWVIEQIKFSKNPFRIYCGDRDGGYCYTEDQLFRPDREFDIVKEIIKD